MCEQNKPWRRTVYVKIHMKNGDRYTGIKCGSEDGLLFLVNPRQITLVSDGPDLDDACLMPDDEMESKVGTEVLAGHETVRILHLPMDDIQKTEPA